MKDTRPDIPLGHTFDERGKVLSYKDSNGWYEYTRNKRGQVLTFEDCEGYWEEYTRDERGEQLAYNDALGYWYEYTYDKEGRQLTYKSSSAWIENFYDLNIQVYNMKVYKIEQCQ